MNTYRQRVLKVVKHNRQVILDGGVNCIPISFNRFRQDLPGIQRFYYVVSGKL